jgi:hypothetical protein
LEDKTNSGIAPMKTMHISAAAAALFMSGTAFAREAAVSPIARSHGARIAEQRVAQFTTLGEGGILCTTEIIPTRDDRGWYLREAVDCEE